MDDVTRNLISLFWRAVLRVFASLVRIKKVEETKKSSWRLKILKSALKKSLNCDFSLRQNSL